MAGRSMPERRTIGGGVIERLMKSLWKGHAGQIKLKGMPHTIKIERRENELVVHLALLDGPRPRLAHGVLLHSEGWIDIGYGLRMFLVIGSVNTTFVPPMLEQKRSILNRLLGRKPEQPLLEDKSS